MSVSFSHPPLQVLNSRRHPPATAATPCIQAQRSLGPLLQFRATPRDSEPPAGNGGAGRRLRRPGGLWPARWSAKWLVWGHVCTEVPVGLRKKGTWVWALVDITDALYALNSRDDRGLVPRNYFTVSPGVPPIVLTTK